MSHWEETKEKKQKERSGAERLLTLLSQLPDDILEEALDYEVSHTISKTAEAEGDGTGRQQKKGKQFLQAAAWLAACVGVSVLCLGPWRDVGEGIRPTDGLELTIAGLPTEAQNPGGPTLSETTSQGGFWYEGTWFEPQPGETLAQLPEGTEVCGTLVSMKSPETNDSTEDRNTVGEDWQTDSDRLVGCLVYRSKEGVFYVEEEGMYRCYRPVSTGEEIGQQSGEEAK